MEEGILIETGFVQRVRAAVTTGALVGWLRSFKPVRPRYRPIEFARGGIGAFAGIVVASVLVRVFGLGPVGLPFIVAPIGASAVLVFAAPASPLAQPWAVFGGNTVSALVGILAARLFDDTMVAAAVAVGCAILAMMLLNCLHPPGGACALFAAVGAGAVREQGIAFAFWPVAMNTAVLLMVAMIVNNATGRQYPHVPIVAPAGPSALDRPPTQRIGVQTDDIEAAMRRLNQGLDVMPADVVALVREAEQHAINRRLGNLKVGTIMARDVETVHPEDSLFRARLLMNRHHLKAIPVVSADRHVLGIVSITDLFNLDVAELADVRSVMSSPVITVRDDSPVADIIRLMTDRGLRHIPVLDDDDHLAGIVTRAELIAVLHQALLDGSDGGEG
ncbi:MAG: HPP family protein [Ilumatobacteraceae bacterium]